jgi:predicted house-cleaning noncanonical NTP pyrophosphatase (MazG superfamily)
MIKSVIKKILSEQIEGSKEGPLSRKEIIFFKELNKERYKYPTQKELLGHIQSMMPFIGRSKSDGRLYYEVYTQNFRPEGDYENITFETFKNYKEFIQKRVTNSTAYEYSSNKIPFKGSNLEGYWDVGSGNKWYYVVKSYEWYPIFLFINDKWFGNVETYSSTTSKQMSQSNPVRYNSGLNSDVTYVRKQDLENLMSGKSFEDIDQRRIKDFVDNFNDISVTKLITLGSRWQNNQKKVRFRIMELNIVDGVLNMKIYIDKAGNVVDNKLVVNDEEYTEDFANDIEEGLRNYLISKYKEFLSHKNTKFIFIHP